MCSRAIVERAENLFEREAVNPYENENEKEKEKKKEELFVDIAIF